MGQTPKQAILHAAKEMHKHKRTFFVALHYGPGVTPKPFEVQEIVCNGDTCDIASTHGQIALNLPYHRLRIDKAHIGNKTKPKGAFGAKNQAD